MASTGYAFSGDRLRAAERPRIGLAEVAIAVFIFTTVFFGEGTIASVVGKLLLFAVALFGVLSGQPVKFTPFLWSALTFLILCTLSLTWSVAPASSFDRVWTLAYQFFAYFALTNLVAWRRERLEYCFTWVVVSALASGINVVLVQQVTFQEDRYVDGVIAAGQLALTSALGIAICVYRFSVTRSNRYLLVLAALAVFLVLTSGRRGFLLIVLFLALYWLFGARSLGQKVAFGIAGLGAAATAYWMAMNIAPIYAFVGARIDAYIDFVRGEGVGDASAQGRSTLIEYGMKLFRESPYVGNGIDSFSPLFSQLHGSWSTSADNNYVQLLADLGVVGTLAYYVPLFIFLFSGVRGVSRKPTIVRFAIATVLAMTLLDFASVWFFSKVGMLMIALCYMAVYFSRTALRFSELGETGHKTHASARRRIGESTRRSGTAPLGP